MIFFFERTATVCAYKLNNARYENLDTHDAHSYENTSFEKNNSCLYAFILQTAWHSASASRMKFSHDGHNTDNDCIFTINGISISNRKLNDTMTNAFVFVEHGL